MKNKYLIIAVIIIIVILLIIFLIIKNQNKEKNPSDNNTKEIKLDESEEIKSITYSYTGTYIGDIYTYSIYKDEDNIKLKVEYMNINEDNPDIEILDNEILIKIMELIRQYKVNEMAGFHKSDKDILDGSSFYISIKLESGKTIDFSGTNCAPDGYYNFEKEFLNLIKDKTDKIKEKYDL